MVWLLPFPIAVDLADVDVPLFLSCLCAVVDVAAAVAAAFVVFGDRLFPVVVVLCWLAVVVLA